MTRINAQKDEDVVDSTEVVVKTEQPSAQYHTAKEQQSTTFGHQWSEDKKRKRTLLGHSTTNQFRSANNLLHKRSSAYHACMHH